MKRLMAALFLVLLAVSAWAASVSLSWNASPTPGVTYTVYRNGTAFTTVSGLSAVDTNPPMATVAYTVTAVSTEGIESNPSNEVVLNLGKPGAPASLRAVFNR